MDEVLLKLIAQLNSSVFILLLILIAVGFALYKLGKWTETFANHEKRIDGLHDMSSKVIELKTKVDLIYQYVNPHAPIRSQSPINLTPTGEEIVQKINANSIVAKYATRLKNDVELTKPRNAYDIQMRSMQIAKEKLLSCLDEAELAIVKQEAYARGLLVEDILSVFGVLLRNIILAEKGIPISQVDEHAIKS